MEEKGEAVQCPSCKEANAVVHEGFCRYCNRYYSRIKFPLPVPKFFVGGKKEDELQLIHAWRKEKAFTFFKWIILVSAIANVVILINDYNIKRTWSVKESIWLIISLSNFYIFLGLQFNKTRLILTPQMLMISQGPFPLLYRPTVKINRRDAQGLDLYYYPKERKSPERYLIYVCKRDLKIYFLPRLKTREASIELYEFLRYYWYFDSIPGIIREK